MIHQWMYHSDDNEWQRMTASDATNDDEWQRMTTSDATSDNEWYNKWQRVVQQVTTNGNEWLLLVISANIPLFRIKEEPTTKHSKQLFKLWGGEEVLRRSTNSKKQEFRQFFVYDIYNFKNLWR